MAELIPYDFPRTVGGISRNIVNAVLSDYRAAEWVVFHSYWQRDEERDDNEIFFIVLAPNLGMFTVLACNEAVAGSDRDRLVSRAELFTNELLELISENGVKGVHVGVGYAVTGEDHFQGDIQDELVYSSRNKGDFASYVRRLADHYVTYGGSSTAGNSFFKAPGASDVEKIRLLLRHRYDKIMSLDMLAGIDDRDENDTYDGKDRYVFISYSHGDHEVVLPVIKRLQDHHLRVWFDSRIEAGTDWRDEIADHIVECELFLVFMSKNYIASDNCRSELNFADRRKKKRLIVFIEEVEKMPAGIEMSITSDQNIHRNKFAGDAEFIRSILACDAVAACKTREVKLVSDQLDVLDKLIYSKSAIVQGSAGTGKTLLAVELAKRKATNPAAKVALVTHKLLLTDYLKRQVSKYDNITVLSITDYFEKKCIELGYITDDDLTYRDDPSREKKSAFYDTILPKKARREITREPMLFDTLIVDESQDISLNYLLILSKMLRGRFAGGNFYLFGDFLYQVLYRTDVFMDDFCFYIDALGGKPVYLELNTNVRNSPAVLCELEKVSGAISLSDNNVANANAETPNCYLSYKDEEEELSMLEDLLDDLINRQNFKPNQITILSRQNFEISVASRVDPAKFKVEIFSFDSDTDVVTYERIARFKGLDKDIIIVVDNNEYRTDKGSDLYLLYVAISRAREQFFVLESDSAANVRRKMVAPSAK